MHVRLQKKIIYLILVGVSDLTALRVVGLIIIMVKAGNMHTIKVPVLMIFLCGIFISGIPAEKKIPKNTLYPILNEYVRELYKEFKNIPEERRFRLNEIVRYVEEQRDLRKLPQLMFINTDDATMSHMARIWAKTAAYYFRYERLETFSGGIKPQKITLNTILALEKAGFIIYKSDMDGLEFYKVKFSYNIPSLLVFPKKTDHKLNPTQDYLAVFTEENAELNLPKLRGTLNRLLLVYDDPQGFEGVENIREIYDNRCRQVAIEMFYVFAQLRRRDKNKS